MPEKVAVARAHANIALAKYWGKSDGHLNLPAVPSISITLSPLMTETRVHFAPEHSDDSLTLDGYPAREQEVKRVRQLLDRVRREAGIEWCAQVQSHNQFPTAAGLASSASGFCALAAAARAAAGLRFDRRRVAVLARYSSASAARSAYGGYVELPAGKPGEAALAASPLFSADYWDLCIVVAVTAKGRKKLGSTDGMTRSQETSPYYRQWVEFAPRLCDEIRAGLEHKDLPRLGRAMEQSTLAMHACASAADPGVVYFQPGTLAVWQEVRAMREVDGLEAYATADAGPHVKVLCRLSQAVAIEARLAACPGVIRTLRAVPGAGVSVSTEEDHGDPAREARG